MRNLSFCTLYGVWVDNFHKKFRILEKKVSFNFITFNFFRVITASLNIKRQSEHSGLRLDTSSLVEIRDHLFKTRFKNTQ